MKKSVQQTIAHYMDRLNPLCESPSLMGMSSLMAGGTDAVRDDFTLDSGSASVTEVEEGNSDETFTPEQLKIAKHYIDLMGGAEKAHLAIDKVDECEECLGLVDDEDQDEQSDAKLIQRIAGMVPGLPDLPMELSNMYNPSAVNLPG